MCLSFYVRYVFDEVLSTILGITTVNDLVLRFDTDPQVTDPQIADLQVTDFHVT
jgi:hypothetical protein